MPNSDSKNSEGSIVRDVLAGQHDRFAGIVHRHQSALLRAATSRLGRRDWAEDVVQETFYWAFKCLKSYDSRYSFRTWLWTILWNQCNRHYKKRAKHPQINAASDCSGPHAVRSLMEGTVDTGASPSAKLLAKERCQQLDLFLNQLPDPQADALRLRFFGELKFHEIADVAGCSLSSAKHRVRNGLLRLGKLMADAEPACDASTGDLK